MLKIQILLFVVVICTIIIQPCSSTECCPQRKRTVFGKEITWGCMGCGKCNVMCCNCDNGCCPDGRKRRSTSIENDWSQNATYIFNEADINNSGTIDYNEFVQYLTKYGSQTPQVTFETHFNQTDYNHNGVIEREEFSQQFH